MPQFIHELFMQTKKITKETTIVFNKISNFIEVMRTDQTQDKINALNTMVELFENNVHKKRLLVKKPPDNTPQSVLFNDFFDVLAREMSVDNINNIQHSAVRVLATLVHTKTHAHKKNIVCQSDISKVLINLIQSNTVDDTIKIEAMSAIISFAKTRGCHYHMTHHSNVPEFLAHTIESNNDKIKCHGVAATLAFLNVGKKNFINKIIQSSRILNALINVTLSSSDEAKQLALETFHCIIKLNNNAKLEIVQAPRALDALIAMLRSSNDNIQKNTIYLIHQLLNAPVENQEYNLIIAEKIVTIIINRPDVMQALAQTTLLNDGEIELKIISICAALTEVHQKHSVLATNMPHIFDALTYAAQSNHAHANVLAISLLLKLAEKYQDWLEITDKTPNIFETLVKFIMHTNNDHQKLQAASAIIFVIAHEREKYADVIIHRPSILLYALKTLFSILKENAVNHPGIIYSLHMIATLAVNTQHHQAIKENFWMLNTIIKIIISTQHHNTYKYQAIFALNQLIQNSFFDMNTIKDHIYSILKQLDAFIAFIETDSFYDKTKTNELAMLNNFKARLTTAIHSASAASRDVLSTHGSASLATPNQSIREKTDNILYKWQRNFLEKNPDYTRWKETVLGGRQATSLEARDIGLPFKNTTSLTSLSDSLSDHHVLAQENAPVLKKRKRG